MEKKISSGSMIRPRSALVENGSNKKSNVINLTVQVDESFIFKAFVPILAKLIYESFCSFFPFYYIVVTHPPYPLF